MKMAPFQKRWTEHPCADVKQRQHSCLRCQAQPVPEFARLMCASDTHIRRANSGAVACNHTHLVLPTTQPMLLLETSSQGLLKLLSQHRSQVLSCMQFVPLLGPCPPLGPCPLLGSNMTCGGHQDCYQHRYNLVHHVWLKHSGTYHTSAAALICILSTLHSICEPRLSLKESVHAEVEGRACHLAGVLCYVYACGPVRSSSHSCGSCNSHAGGRTGRRGESGAVSAPPASAGRQDAVFAGPGWDGMASACWT